MSAITICFFLTVVVKLTLLLYIIGYVGFPRTSGAGWKDFTVNYENHQHSVMNMVIREKASLVKPVMCLLP